MNDPRPLLLGLSLCAASCASIERTPFPNGLPPIKVDAEACDAEADVDLQEGKRLDLRARYAQVLDRWSRESFPPGSEPARPARFRVKRTLETGIYPWAWVPIVSMVAPFFHDKFDVELTFEVDGQVYVGRGSQTFSAFLFSNPRQNFEMEAEALKKALEDGVRSGPQAADAAR